MAARGNGACLHWVRLGGMGARRGGQMDIWQHAAEGGCWVVVVCVGRAVTLRVGWGGGAGEVCKVFANGSAMKGPKYGGGGGGGRGLSV